MKFPKYFRKSLVNLMQKYSTSSMNVQLLQQVWLRYIKIMFWINKNGKTTLYRIE